MPPMLGRFESFNQKELIAHIDRRTSLSSSAPEAWSAERHRETADQADLQPATSPNTTAPQRSQHKSAKPGYLIAWELENESWGVQVTEDPLWDYRPVAAIPDIPLLRRDNQLDASTEENGTSVFDLPFAEILRLTAELRYALCHETQARHDIRPGTLDTWPFGRDDLEQEAALALWRALPKFRGKSSFVTFAYRVMGNALITYERRHHHTADPLELRDSDDASDPLESLSTDPTLLPAIFQSARRVTGGIELLTAAFRSAHPALRQSPLDTSEAGRKRRQRARTAFRRELCLDTPANPRPLARNVTAINLSGDDSRAPKPHHAGRSALPLAA